MKNIVLLAQANFGGGLQPVTEAYSTGSTTGAGAVANAEKIISQVVGFLTILAGIYFIFYMVMAGINWIGAGGDQGKVQKARDEINQAVMGLVITVMAYGLIGLIGRIIGLNLLSPGAEVLKLSPL
jgi:hypothetical protein